MSRKKDKSEVEHLKGVIRSLKSELRNLRKQVKTARKGTKQSIEEDIDDDVDYVVPYDSDNKCPECFKGTTKSIDLGIRIITTCTMCTWKEVKKK